MNDTTTDSIFQAYERDGYYFPLQVLSRRTAGDYARRLTAISEGEHVNTLGYRGQLNHLHVVCPYINDMVRDPTILDAVESLLGPDILIWGSALFVKPAQTPTFVSWHQDLTYWGLSSDREVAAWFALGPVTRENGCMRFISGSHKMGSVPHRDTHDSSNVLTRGQYADVGIDEENAVYVELEPGQVSLHHGHLLHGSVANNSDIPRVGIVVNYIATSVAQSVSKTDFAMLVRGEDNYNNFLHLPNPKAELDEQGLSWHKKIVEAQSEALYEGAENTGQ
jgi:non-heme Fe2+,alpha-ketoglutarate-dependent halogenase